MCRFSCPLNKDVENFFKNKAVLFDKTHNARTYLVLSKNEANLLGYFSLSFKEISLINPKLSGTTKKRLDGISKTPEKVRAYLLGQISKNASIPDNPLKLLDLMKDVYSVLKEAQDRVGGRVIILECEKNPKLIELYSQNEFKVLQEEEKFLLMYRIFDI